MRLRESTECSWASCARHFNSSLVRLREKHGILFVLEIIRFQFQFGAIKSSFLRKSWKYSNIFQFQFGAIKRWLGLNWQLKFLKFQFQFGAIKSHCFGDRHESERIFQFQFGAIKRWLGLNWQLKFLKFQFQFGAIKSRNNRIVIYILKLISIPVWCD